MKRCRSGRGSWGSWRLRSIEGVAAPICSAFGCNSTAWLIAWLASEGGAYVIGQNLRCASTEA